MSWVPIETLAAPDHFLSGPATGRLFHWSRQNLAGNPIKQSPCEHTRTTGATPRKTYRLLKNQPQVNERRPGERLDSAKNASRIATR